MHCAAKPIVQLAIIAKRKWVFTPGVLRFRDQLSMSWTHYPLSHWSSNPKLLPYYKIRNELTVESGFIYKGQNLIIPEVQNSILSNTENNLAFIEQNRLL